MSVLATDDFNRADGAVGANWTTNALYSAMQITSNKCGRTDAHGDGIVGGYYTAISWPNDHYSQCKITASGTRVNVGVRVVNNSGEFDGYVFEVKFTGTATRSILKYTHGVGYTSLTSGSVAVSLNDVLYLEVQGTNLVAKVNGTTVLSVSDSSFSSGNAGIPRIGAEDTVESVDDWAGGDFLAAGMVIRSVIVPNRFVGPPVLRRQASRTFLAPVISSTLNAYTLTISAGSYAITGTATNLLYGRKVTASAGSYAITGTSNNLYHGYKSTISAGSYTITGTAVTLTHQFKMTVSGGSYTLSGTAVGLYRGYPLTIGAGSYSISGTAVSLYHGYRGVIGAGSYSLTGTSTNLLWGHKITVTAGSYSISGSAVTLTHQSVLSIGSGSYAISGSSVALNKGRSLTIGSGSYTLTGTAVAFPRTYRMVASAGSYVLTGSSVTLTWSDAALVVTHYIYAPNRSDVVAPTRLALYAPNRQEVRA